MQSGPPAFAVRRPRCLAVLALLCLAVQLPARSGDWRFSPRALRLEVEAVVRAQLAALRREDFGAAYGHAAAGIRRQFTPEVFAAMIRRGYPALPAHVRSEFGRTRDDRAGRAEAEVVLFDDRDRRTDWRYLLVLEEGRWRIEGVRPGDPPGRSDI